MVPDKPAAQLDKRSATRLRDAHCLFHPLREAAARCPRCGGTFCRECVTEEEGQLACPPCLRRMAHPPAPKVSQARQFQRLLAGIVAIVTLTAIFFLMLRWRTNTPEQHLNLGGVTYSEQREQTDE